MTVAEFILELQKLPPDATVVAFSGRYEDGAFCPASFVELTLPGEGGPWPEDTATDKPYIRIWP